MPKYFNLLTFRVITSAFTILLAVSSAHSQSGTANETAFKVGERITYSVSFDKYHDIAYAEIYTVSRGALSGKDAVELRLKLKTLNFFSAALYEVNELRTTFAAPDSGLPLFISRTENPGGIPKETGTDLTKSPAANFDLLTLIYKIRQSGGSGAANFQEKDKAYDVTFQPSGSENINTSAGDFETTIVSIQSEYFTELGIREVRVNLSNDESHIPVVVRIKMTRGEFRAEAASVQMLVPEPAVLSVPIQANTPIPTPASTPELYIDNRPLATELSFELGESLEYRVTTNGRQVGSFVMRAGARKQINGEDTLVLTVTVTNSASGNPLFELNDSIMAQVNPETLSPRKIEIKLSKDLNSISETAIFDERNGAISYKGTNRVDAPIGTHSILSLIYAMRSFNLKPSKTLNNPVNDTRVAVFWDSRPYVFTLRPSAAESITVGGEKVSAQMISINTGNPQLDQLAIKVWLGNDEHRLPLRFSVGSYQAELASITNVPSN